MKLGSLFSGGGLGDFGFMAAGFDIRWQVEIDDYCQKILALRYPESKKYRDIKTLKGAKIEKVDIIIGGFPCQPFSVAGKRMGSNDDRHLWTQMFRIIQEIGPTWVVGENVSGFVDMALDDVCANLESAGYETTTLIFPSHALGAWHRRERVWIVAYAGCEHGEREKVSGEYEGEDRQENATQYQRSDECDRFGSSSDSTNTGSEKMCGRQISPDETIADSGLLRSQEHEKQTTGFEQLRKSVSNTNSVHGKGSWPNNDSQRRQGSSKRSAGLCGSDLWRKYWQSEPAVGRVANGITRRVERLKMLGNGQVPACTYVIGKMIMEIENNGC